MKLLLLWSFSVQLFMVSLAFRNLGGNDTDRLSLLEFKAKTIDPLGALNQWNESAHFCDWPGVTCGRQHRRVTSLFIYSSKLGGDLSPHIGNLSFLKRLDLINNSFSGQIPEEIGRLFRLRVLRLLNNSFSGSIPVNLTRCSSLEHLMLDNNKLAGELFPAGISGSLFRSLKLLSMTSNRLSGEIPSSVANLSDTLEFFSVSENDFRGGIPDSFGRLRNVWFLSLGGNYLGGKIPPSIYNLSSIQVFSVNTNRLHGELPSGLGSSLLPNLQEFFFHTNRFSGSFPAISNASNLVNFQITLNRLTGKVSNFAGLPKLKILTLGGNHLGLGEDNDDNDDDDLSFLTSLVNLTSLEVLELYHNNFGGKLPDSISNFSRNLWWMALGRNRIRGSIPTGIGNLVNLQVLEFEQNRLSGSIPRSIGNLQKLYELSLENNNFSGTIPISLGNLTSLNRLSLASNNLGGFLPASLGDCKSLVLLNLSQNDLSGPIPKEVIGLPSLSLGLYLSRNRFAGSIPREVGKLVNLGRLDLSDNELSGEIPEALGDCQVLEYLSLGGNLLQGNIPKSLGSLKGIKEIDLSRNNLSGKIPTYLADFRTLQKLNLSANNFESEIPSKGVFANASAVFIAGNPRLCGGIAQLHLPKCPSNTTHRQRQSTKLIVSVVCGLVATLLLALFLGLLLWSRKRTVKSVSEPLFGVSFLELSYRDLLKATEGFSSENLIGSGSFGSVFRGKVLNQDSQSVPVAVKVLNLQVSAAAKSFVAECRVLGSVRHRNVVKLVTACSSIDSKGDDFKALVYEFVVNGGLEEWLHGRRETRLTFIQRVNVAIDVANALDHLHNHSHLPIVHSDLKPSNILLDGDMIARVGDFGLARFLGDPSRLFSLDDQSISIGIRGSIGYIAPEYSMGGELSREGDVYSYGIVLLEMFTGKRPTDEMFGDSLNLHNFVKASLSSERLFLVADSTLLVQTDRVGQNGTTSNFGKCLYSILGIGISCSEEMPKERMSIGDVLKELERIRIAYSSHERGD